MKIKLLRSCLLATGMLLVSWVAGAQSTNQIHFPLAGFSVAPLDQPPGDSTQVPLAMCLPATDGFAPNINVQIQPYTGTIDDYVALSLGQFKQLNFKLVQKKALGKTVAVFEYTGEQGRPLHWYSRAEKSGGSVYLVTATATEEGWTKVATRLKACVDSFHCDHSK